MKIWRDENLNSFYLFSDDCSLKSLREKLKVYVFLYRYLIFLMLSYGSLLVINAEDNRSQEASNLKNKYSLADHKPRQKRSDIKNINANVDDLYTHLLPQVTPVKNARLGSRFGDRSDPFTRRLKHHAGQDFPAPYGTPIRAAAAGVVVRAGYHKSYGYMIDIDHGTNLLTRYGHASKLLVDLGQIVQRGQQIALVGSTGRSTGPHLHFEVHWHGIPVNPLKFLQNELAVLKNKGSRSVNVRKNHAY